MNDEEIPVLIAGGSLVGLSSAVLLAWHGVRSLVVERHRGTAIHPRAAYFNQRTFEVYRSVGLEEEISRRAHEEFLQDGAIMAVESLAGRELAWFVSSLNEGVRDVSPSMRLYCTQNVLEPILRRRAGELGAETTFGSEIVSFESDGRGVTAVVRNLEDGHERSVRARYLIGADGNRSPVRRRLGIGMRGRGTFSDSATIYFKADIRPALRERPLSVIYVNNAALKGFMRFEAHGRSGFLAVNVAYGPDGRPSDIEAADASRCAQLVRDAIGVQDLDVEIVAVQPWKAAAETAERFREGPVFLAGDAAHVMPPTGGFGGNTGVHDAHNLAWKIAYVLSGRAGPDLLNTYDAERRPAGTFTVEQAYTRYVKRTDPSLGDHDIQSQEDDLRIELGVRYRSVAICPVEQNGDGGHAHPRESRAMPGTRAPHLTLKRDGAEISTLDLFGRNFTLLAGSDGAAWCRAARVVAAELGLEVDALMVGGGRERIADATGKFTETYGIEPAGCVLVRPDGFVAWRSRAAQEAPEQALAYSLKHLLCRAPEPSRRSEAA